MVRLLFFVSFGALLFATTVTASAVIVRQTFVHQLFFWRCTKFENYDVPVAKNSSVHYEMEAMAVNLLARKKDLFWAQKQHFVLGGCRVDGSRDGGVGFARKQRIKENDTPVFTRDFETSFVRVQWENSIESSTLTRIQKFYDDNQFAVEATARTLPRSLSGISSHHQTGRDNLARVEVLRMLGELGFLSPQTVRKANSIDVSGGEFELERDPEIIERRIPDLLLNPKGSPSTNSVSWKKKVREPAGNAAGNFRCLGSSAFSIFESEATWLDVPRYFIGLFDETGVVDQEAALQLAQTYTYFGFTIEAAQVLEMADIDSTTGTVIQSILKILDQEKNEIEGEIRAFSGCNSSADLWIFLADSEPSSKFSVDVDGIVRAYLDLPLHIRGRIGEYFQYQLTKIGADAAASLVGRNAALSNSSIAPSTRKYMNLSASSISIPKSQKVGETLRSILSELEDNPFVSSQRVLQLVEGNLRILKEDVNLIGSYSTQYRNEKTGNFLRQAYVLALAKSGQYQDSFKELRVVYQEGESIEFLVNLIFSNLVEHESNIVFLSKIVLHGEVYASKLEAQIKRRVIARMVELGFSHLASKIFKFHMTPLAQNERINVNLPKNIPPKTMSKVKEAYEESVSGRIASAITKFHLERNDFNAAAVLAKKYNLKHELETIHWSTDLESRGSLVEGDLMEQVSMLNETDSDGFDGMGSFLALADSALQLIQTFEDIIEHDELRE